MLHKAWNSKGEMPYCFPRWSIKFQSHTVRNITDFDPNWAFPDYRPVAAFESLRFALFLILVLFWLRETFQIWGFQAFWLCSVDFPHYGDPLTETGHIWGFWALSGEYAGVNVEGGGGIFPTLCVEFCLVIILPLSFILHNQYHGRVFAGKIL